MNTFGLGLVLNFTDNASAGMSRVSQTFNQMNDLASQLVDSSDSAALAVMSLSATGTTLSIIGEQMSDIGSSILGLFAGISQSVIDTGMTMQGFRMKLQALYGEDSYESKIQEIKQYAEDSVFEVESLITAVTTMKAVGIEAMDEITTSSGNTTQKLLDYASDIAAMVPNMRNAYGTGVNAAIGALKEYIAEGNALSLKRGAGFDILGILDEEKGKTIEERTRQVADLVEVLGIAGYTTSLMGTPTQQLSRMQDVLFNAMSDIADSGVFETYTKLLSTVADWLTVLTSDTEKYNKVVSIVGGAIMTIMTPLQSILEWVIQVADAFINWALEHETLAKYILIVVASFGALLLIGGQILKFAGSIFLVASALTQMSVLARGGVSIFNTFKNVFGMVAIKLLSILPLAALVYTVWTTNLFGIRDTAKKVVKDIGDILSVIGDAWGDNTLSDENFKKALDLGILPLVEGLLQLKYYWGFLVEGFKTGFSAFFDGLEESLSKLGILDIDLSGIVSALGRFLDNLVAIGAEDKWTTVGETFGKIVGFVILLIASIKALKGVFSIISFIVKLFSGIVKVVSVIIKVVSFIGTVFAKVGGIFKIIGGAIMGVLSAISTALGIPVAGVVALIAVIISLGITIYEKFGEIASYVFTTFTEIFDGIKTIFGGIIDFFTGVFTGDWELAWQGIIDIFKGVWETLTGVVRGVVNGIILIVNTLISTLYRILAGVVNGIGGIFNAAAGALGLDLNLSIPKTPPQIPYLAKGGKVTEPVTAVIGEGDDEEVVLPLNNQVFNEIAKGINNNRPTQTPNSVTNDYSVTFSPGSVIIQLANATDAELEKAAEKLMRIIERKQQLKRMAVRT